MPDQPSRLSEDRGMSAVLEILVALLGSLRDPISSDFLSFINATVTLFFPVSSIQHDGSATYATDTIRLSVRVIWR